MRTTSKIAISLGIASGALLAAYLLTGSRKEKTKQFISRNANTLKKTIKPEKKKKVVEESEAYYI